MAQIATRYLTAAHIGRRIKASGPEGQSVAGRLLAVDHTVVDISKGETRTVFTVEVSGAEIRLDAQQFSSLETLG